MDLQSATYRLSSTRLSSVLLTGAVAVAILLLCGASWYVYVLLAIALVDALFFWKEIFNFSVQPTEGILEIRLSLTKPRLTAPLNSLSEVRLLQPSSFSLRGLNIFGFSILELTFNDGRRLQSGFLFGFPSGPYQEDVMRFYKDARRYLRERKNDPSALWIPSPPLPQSSQREQRVLVWKFIGRTIIAMGLIGAIGLSARPFFSFLQSVLPKAIAPSLIAVALFGYAASILWFGWSLVLRPMFSANQAFLSHLQHEEID